MLMKLCNESMMHIKRTLRQPIFLSLRFDVRTYSASSTLPKDSFKGETNRNSSLKTDTGNSHYYFEDGLRKVYPFIHRHRSFCRGRWINKKIIDAYFNEFALYSREETEQRIKKGIVKVNDRVVDLDYVLKNADLLTADVHKHELPVLSCPIEILFENDDFLVVDKPPSIPVHPCGLYVKNSMLSILSNEYNKDNLYIIHRLDRLTSGVLIFVKSSEKSRDLHVEMDLRTVNKEYLCRVEGNFPDGTVMCNKPVKLCHHRIGVTFVDPKGKIALTEFKKLSYNGKSSVLLCKPHTGRTHQIRVHLQYLGHPIINDPIYNSSLFGSLKGKNGMIEKPITQLLEELLHEQCSDWGLENNPIRNIPNENKYLNFTIFKEYYNMSEEIPGYKKDCSRITFDEDCYFCKLPYQNPIQNTLGIFLHAFKYEGYKWSFNTKLPFWASDNWNIA